MPMARPKGLTAVAGKIQDKVKGSEAIQIEVKYGKKAMFFTDPALWQNPEDYCDVDAKLAMLPVWFLTYKNKKRVFYSVINGFTGKMFAGIPVDVKKTHRNGLPQNSLTKNFISNSRGYDKVERKSQAIVCPAHRICSSRVRHRYHDKMV